MSKSWAGVRPEFAKDKEYFDVLNIIDKTEKCPFCPDNFKYHEKPIILEYNDWIATENSWPYKAAEYHFIFISKEHKINFSDITSKDFEALQYLINFVIEKYGINGGGVCMRFGDQTYTGATVQHIHAHLIVPKIQENWKAEVVYFPIG